MTQLYSSNYKTLNQEIQKDMGRWSVLTVVFSSGIEISKMNVLKRIRLLKFHGGSIKSLRISLHCIATTVDVLA